jgi:copper chaperone
MVAGGAHCWQLYTRTGAAGNRFLMVFPTETREVTLAELDVSCQHCVNAIAKALGEVAGVAQAQTDLASKTVRVRFDPQQVSLDRITEALDEAGYPVANT